MSDSLKDLNPWIYSNRQRWVSDDSEAGGHFLPISWKEIAEEQSEEIRRLKGFQKIVADLDRNENGRHEGDVDSYYATGVSVGNPRLKTGDILGYDISGRPYIMPERGLRHDPEAWMPERKS